MQNLLILILFPLVWPFIAKKIWHAEISWQEMFLNIAIIVLISIGIWQLGKNYQTWDVEIWNGQVLGKEKTRVSCEHSYPCNCKTTKDGTSCDICYEHNNDWDWSVFTNVGDFTIERIDRQGKHEPPRWTKVQKEQPVALNKSYTNYVKAVPESLFHANAELNKKFANKIPSYPSHIYDYHYLDRVLSIGVNVPDIKKWNDDLSLMLREIGPNKQANVIILFVNEADPSYEYAIQSAWVGAKKNDIVVIIGITNYPDINWVRIVSWTDKQLFKVQLKDDIMDISTVDKDKILSTIKNDTLNLYQRKHMRDFEYLDSEILPPDWVIVLAVMVSTIGSILLSVWFKYYNLEYSNGSIRIRRKIIPTKHFSTNKFNRRF